MVVASFSGPDASVAVSSITSLGEALISRAAEVFQILDLQTVQFSIVTYHADSAIYYGIHSGVIV